MLRYGEDLAGGWESEVVQRRAVMMLGAKLRHRGGGKDSYKWSALGARRGGAGLRVVVKEVRS